jgi:hypothetical protein
MTDITITIPLELTAAQIIRLNDKQTAVNEADEARARELAAELHGLLALVQEREAAPTRPLTSEEAAELSQWGIETSPPSPFARVDLIDAMRRFALGLAPMNPRAVAEEADWIYEQLDNLGDSLCDRYLRLCKRIDPRLVTRIGWEAQSELQ